MSVTVLGFRKLSTSLAVTQTGNVTEKQQFYHIRPQVSTNSSVKKEETDRLHLEKSSEGKNVHEVRARPEPRPRGGAQSRLQQGEDPRALHR